jgi:hypothetical protein
VATTLQKQLITPSDVNLAYYRASDGALAVADTSLGDSTVVRRLYEFIHVFCATGSISWGTPTNTLITSAITIQFLSRESTYTVSATGGGGVVIPSGYAWYVTIPDADKPATLTGHTTKIGTGFLDRAGKLEFPLFWNLGGTLYSSFAPFNFGEGGSGSVGGVLSDEMIEWLGSGSAIPDPTNHGYTSTNFILQSDDLPTAIGKLDAAIADGDTFAAKFNDALIPLTLGNTSVVVTFGTPRGAATYRLFAQLENTTDATPMIQPVEITAKATTGFTVSWPAPLDSGNYILDYLLKDA